MKYGKKIGMINSLGMDSADEYHGNQYNITLALK